MCLYDLRKNVFQTGIESDKEVVVCLFGCEFMSSYFRFANDLELRAMDLFEYDRKSLELAGVILEFAGVLANYFLDNDEFSEVSI
jgi:hypothetical protein